MSTPVSIITYTTAEELCIANNPGTHHPVGSLCYPNETERNTACTHPYHYANASARDAAINAAWPVSPLVSSAEWNAAPYNGKPLPWAEAFRRAGVHLRPDWAWRSGNRAYLNRQGTAGEMQAFASGRNWISSTAPFNQYRLMCEAPGIPCCDYAFLVALAWRWGFPQDWVLSVCMQESTITCSAAGDCSPRTSWNGLYIPDGIHPSCGTDMFYRSLGWFQIGPWYATGAPFLVRDSASFNAELWAALTRGRMLGLDTAVNNVPAGDGGLGYQQSINDTWRMFEGAIRLHFTGPSQWMGNATSSGGIYWANVSEEYQMMRWLNTNFNAPTGTFFLPIPLERPMPSIDEIMYYASAA